MMSITGECEGDPVRVGVTIADIGAGMYATQSILAALLARELQDVGGQKIDVSLLDSQAAWISYMATNYFASGETPGTSILEAELGEYTTEEAVALLGEHDVPARAVHDMADVFSHPQIAACEMVREVDHPRGTIEMPGSPMFLSETPTSIRQRPPEIGEHTGEILGEAGYTDGEIAGSRDADAI